MTPKGGRPKGERRPGGVGWGGAAVAHEPHKEKTFDTDETETTTTDLTARVALYLPIHGN